MEKLVKMKAPEGATSCNHGPRQFQVDSTGHVIVPADAAVVLTSHGYKVVGDAVEQQQATAAASTEPTRKDMEALLVKNGAPADEVAKATDARIKAEYYGLLARAEEDAKPKQPSRDEMVDYLVNKASAEPKDLDKLSDANLRKQYDKAVAAAAEKK